MGTISQIILSKTANTVTFFLMPGTSTNKIKVTTSVSQVTSTGTFTVRDAQIPALQQGTKRVATGSTAISQQGAAVAISADGNTAIVGAPSDNSNIGGAFIYVRNGTTWSQQGGKLVGTGAVGSAKQGTSERSAPTGIQWLSGGVLDNGARGAVWVFTRTGSTWTQQGSKLVGTGITGSAQFGTSVSLSADGHTMAVGAIADNNYKGATCIFTRISGVWGQQGAKLLGTGAVGAARQGCSVALSADGNYLLSGGSYNNNREGAAWLFKRISNVWTQQFRFLGAGGSPGALQGYSVAISADAKTVLIGGPNDAATLTGAVWVFAGSDASWLPGNSTKIVGTGSVGASRQGGAVSLSADGKTAVWVVSATTAMQVPCGSYKRTGPNTWAQQGNKKTVQVHQVLHVRVRQLL
jgi:hypothetical protein